MTNLFFRCLYRLMYLAARAYWWLFRPRMRAAVVAVWHANQLLFVKPSYRPHMTLPGGFVREGEHARDAAAREIAEELGIELAPESLRLVGETEIRSESRVCVETVFEVHLERKPPISVDCREITAARFLAISDARRLIISPIARWYLDRTG
jgi:ADP-ribose pyrophosphatase YjhB (NUDIX family)